ncbi:MAG: CRISPR-associated protein Cas4 [Candidatus Methanospirareceae archaeon]
MKGLSEEIKNFVIKQMEEKHFDDRVGVSELGSCIRKAWYKRKMPRRLDFDTALIRFIGKLFHDCIEVSYPRREVFVQHKLEKGSIVGKIDVIEGGTIIDFKSKKDLSWVEKKGPLERDVNQVKFYSFISGAKKAKLVYYEVKPEIKPADNADKFWWNLRKEIVKEIRKKKPISFDIDVSDVTDVVRDYERRALNLFDSLRKNKPPMPNAEKWECKYCEYRDVCESVRYVGRR